ncbi:hypothetical protein [Streptomyces sp. NPDC048663]|uniref:hypothetical protein n=1 Tax=Streptomyces sp. NPDC048663 TaxID=3155638 RepID=UPI003442ACA3
MTSPPQQRVWYFFSDDLPEEHLIVPIRTAQGLAFGIRPGAMTEPMLQALNQTAEFVLGTGLAHVGHTGKPPDGKE